MPRLIQQVYATEELPVCSDYMYGCESDVRGGNAREAHKWVCLRRWEGHIEEMTFDPSLKS